MIKKITLAYIAGFLDGDGSISIKKRLHKREGWSPQYIVELRFSNTNKDVLEFIQSKFGGHLYVEERPNQNPRWKRRYLLQFSGPKGVVVIKLVLPYLRIKEREAGIALELQQRIKDWPTGQRLSENELLERDILYLACRNAKTQR